MKECLLFVLFFLIILNFKSRLIGLTIDIKTDKREIIPFDKNWKFQRILDLPEMAQPGFDDSKWSDVNLPHDWAIEGFLPAKIEQKKYDLPFISVTKGKWKFNKGDNATWKEINLDDSNWQEVILPQYWEEHSNYIEDNVYGWFRRKIFIPEEWRGKDIIISVGMIDDVDETYFNGVLIGKTGSFPPDFVSAWNIFREYKVDSKYIKYGEDNLIAVRVFDATGPGGIWAEKQEDFIEGPFNKGAEGGSANGYLPGGTGWYRKIFTLPDNWRDKIIHIEFDGIYMDSDVWINGNHLGNHPYGYTSFSYDLTPYLKFGDEKNIISVRVNVKQQCTRWYSGAGIYRHTRLVKTEKIFIPQWGTYITTPEITNEKAKVIIKTKIKNLTEKDEEIKLQTSIFNKTGLEITNAETIEIINFNNEKEITQEFYIENPLLWSLEDPNLYTVLSKIYVKDEIKDVYNTKFGIRKIEFTNNDGFFLNGKKTKIKGVCLHHDNGYLGAAVYKRAIQRQIEIMKEMGANAIRTSHNPPAPEFLDLCDEMGMLVLDEAFDEWKENKVQYGYGRFFDEWAEKDLVSMLRRDRNHPCVILWSIGNEIAEQWAGTSENAKNRAKMLVDICHREDPTRPVTAACNNVEQAIEKGIADCLDIFGINYNPWAYKILKGKRKLIATETASDVSSRGEYNLVLKKEKVVIEPKLNTQCTSYDIFAPDWATTAAASLLAIKEAPWVYGEFVWTGFDYIGEPTPYWWPAVISYFGIVDLCGFPKDRFYLYQSQWTEKPMVHILPHWNWQKFKNKEIPVFVYTNCESVELFLNGESLGEKVMEESKNLRLQWSINYKAGTLLAIAKNNGREVARKEIKTSGNPVRIELNPDRREINSGGEDLSYVTVRLLDKNGIFCPTASNTIKFSLKGNGIIAATGNGNPINHNFFTSKEINAFNGMCLVIIKAGEKPDELILRAESDGLPAAEVIIKTK
jgi:beta-galactosidase